MTIEITAEAIALLRGSLQMANVDPQLGGVRLRAAKALGGGYDVQVELAEGPAEGEVVVRQDGVNVYVDQSVGDLWPDAVVVVSPEHQRIAVRPRTGG